MINYTSPRKIRNAVKTQWKNLWDNVYQDKRKAELISEKDFFWLDIEKGQVISSPRDNHELDIHEILDNILGSEMASRLNPDPEYGGWGKFAKTHFTQKEKKQTKENTSINITKTCKNKGWKNQHKLKERHK